VRKLFIYLVVLALCGLAFAPQKPMLGELLDASQFDMPVAIWLFNEGAGGLVNDSAAGKSITLSEALNWVPGKFGSALAFNYRGYATTSLSLMNRDISIVVWATTSGTDNKGGILGHSAATPYKWFWFGIYEQAQICRVYMGDGDTYDVFSTAAWTGLTGYHQWAVTVSAGGVVRLYFDGIDIGGGTCTKDPVAFTPEISPHNYRPHDGNMDNLAIFKYLSAQQIAQLYQNPFPWFEPDPIELWAIEEAPTGGQVIFINFSSVGWGFGGFGLILLLAIIKKIRNRKQR